MSMEKITKEELLKKLGRTPLSDDELEMVTGGAPEGFESWGACYDHYFDELMVCIDDYTQPEGYFDECMATFNNAMDTICVR